MHVEFYLHIETFFFLSAVIASKLVRKSPRTSNKNASKLKKKVNRSRNSTLSFEWPFYRALWRFYKPMGGGLPLCSQMKRAINILNYEHILSLQKKYHKDTCKNDQMREIQKFHAKIGCLKNSINKSIVKS